jgi:transmembrane sensor
MKEDLFADIITRFLEGNATAHEKELLSSWLKEDPAREEILYFRISQRENERPQYLPEMDSKLEAYEKFLAGGERISKGAYWEEEPVPSRSRHYKWWWLAASVILFISAGFYFLSDSLFYKTYTAGKGMIRSVTLDDGSTVTLNANSSIRVLRDFMDHANREAWINGEAFFEVEKRSDQMKFIVHTGNFDVEVLGTKFNINNRRGKTEVILAEGKLRLVSEDKKPLIMKPGEKVTLSDDNGHYRKRIVNLRKYEAWRNNMLVFENTPLAEVAQIIRDYYGIKVSLCDSLLATRKFTGTLPINDLDLILQALSTAHNIEFERKGDSVILR